MKRVETKVDLNDFPVKLHGLLQAGKLYDSSCSPAARTLYCDVGYYIKTAPKGSLALEAELGRLFHRLGLGVEVMEYVSTDRDDLVTRSADGEDLTHSFNDPEMLCRIMAQGLRKLHSQSVAGIPTSSKLVDYSDLSGFNDYLRMDYIGIHSREEALAVIEVNRDRLKADTLIHGDACLPNVICRDGRFVSFIDCGLAGLGDRHIDLFWAIWSLQFNLKTEGYTEYFLDQYGREHIDFETLKTVAAFELLGGE